MFIFQSKFDNPHHHDGYGPQKKSGTSKKIQWDFQISKVGSLDFLDLKVNGSPAIIKLYGQTRVRTHAGSSLTGLTVLCP